MTHNIANTANSNLQFNFLLLTLYKLYLLVIKCYVISVLRLCWNERIRLTIHGSQLMNSSQQIELANKTLGTSMVAYNVGGWTVLNFRNSELVTRFCSPLTLLLLLWHSLLSYVAPCRRLL